MTPLRSPRPRRSARDDRVPSSALPRSFYARNACVVARALLGRLLVHDTRAGRTAGRILEVEAYGDETDPASHARPGHTARNASMFGAPGHAYIYRSHGIHHCFNVVTGRATRAAAVLVRSLEPRFGLALMARRRRKRDPRLIAPGPGCLGEALGIDLRHDGVDLTRGALWISRSRRMIAGERIGRSARIGIRFGLDRPWRFFIVPSRAAGRRGER
ncbi:MAG: DNA-3-methyladenine glycosylase [Candidatus Eisenbacteria bacterium]